MGNALQNSMHRLMQIVVEGNVGSNGSIAESLGNIAIDNGWQSYIAHGRFSRPSKSKIIKIGNPVEIALHGLETRLFDRHGLGSVLGTKLLIKKIKKIKPALIHLHGIHGYFINIKILFNFLEKSLIPVVWTFHDCWSFTGHCGHFDHNNCDKWKTECNSCQHLNTYPKSFFVDRSKENFNLKKNIFNSVENLTIISVSQWLNALVGKSFLKKKNHDFIYNGVNLDVFKFNENLEKTRNKYNLNKKTVLLGVAAIWSEEKGLLDFFKLSKLINDDQKLILVGLSKSQISTLPKNIVGIMKTENKQELVDLYSVADIFLNPSYEESFGLVTAEALSCGTPAVVYDTTACPEIIDNSTGIVVPKQDVKSFYNAILEIEQNGRSFYTRNCRKRAEELFDEEKNYLQYFSLYNRLIK